MMELSIIGLLVALVCLTVFTMKGVNIYISAIVCALIAIVCAGLSPMTTLKDSFMTGFVTYTKNYYFMFLSGAVFGKLMEITGAAKAIAQMIVKGIGPTRAVIAVPVATGLLCYGGVNAFTSMFCVFPIALEVFRETDIPRRFLAGTIFFGAATFSMVAPGTPQIQNLVPTSAVGETLMAGMVPGFAGCGAMLVIGSVWLNSMVKKAKSKGEHFVALAADIFEQEGKQDHGPNGILSLIPLVITLILVNLKRDGAALLQVETGVFIGCAVILVLLRSYIDWSKIVFNVGEACKNTIFMIGNTAAVVGFGSVIKATPAFNVIVDLALNIPGNALIGCAIGTTIVCGITGSASGGLGISAPVLGPLYVSQGVPAGLVARTMALSSAALDSLPHNGAVVSLITGICSDTHKNAYMPLFWLTVITPLLGTVVELIVAIILM